MVHSKRGIKPMIRLAALPLCLAALPAMAGSFTPPEGCTTHLTVQSQGCYVANYYRCEADAPGDTWRVDFDQEGMFYMSKIDVETQWIESYDLNPPVKQTLDPNPMDPASFSGLVATGYDSFVFGLSKDTGEHSNVRGFDKLTGKTVMIDGEPLLQTEFEYEETDDGGGVLRKARGHEYISTEFGSFFSGSSEWHDGTNWIPLEGSPRQFIRPGEKGFAATQPIFDCDAVMSSLPFSPEPRS